MEKLKNFVNKYKDIFTTDSSHITPFSKKKIIFDIITAKAVITALAVIIGLLTNSIENLSYVVYLIHTIFLGSFVIYIYINEIKNYKINNELNPLITTAFTVIPLVSVVLITNGLFFSSYLSAVSILFNIYLFLILGSISYLIILLLSRYNEMYDRKVYLNIALNVFASIAIYIGIIQVLPFADVRIAYLIGTAFLYSLFFIKKIFVTYQKNLEYLLYYKLILLSFALVFAVRISVQGEGFNTDEFTITDFNVYDTVEFNDFHVSFVNVSTDYYILLDNSEYPDERVYRVYDYDYDYDYDLNLVKELRLEQNDNLEEFNDDFYIITDSYDNGSFSYTVKSLNDDFEVVKEEIIEDVSHGLFLPFGENKYVLPRNNDLVFPITLEVYNTSDKSRTYLSELDFSANEVIYKSKEYIIYTKDGILYSIHKYHQTYSYTGNYDYGSDSRIYYSNDYVAISSVDKTTILPFEDYLTNTYDNEIILKTKIEAFEVYDSYIYTSTKSKDYIQFFNVYDIKGNHKETMKYPTSFNIGVSSISGVSFLNKNLIIANKGKLLLIDSSDSIATKIEQDISVKGKFMAASICLLGIVLLSPQIILKRGENNV